MPTVQPEQTDRFALLRSRFRDQPLVSGNLNAQKNKLFIFNHHRRTCTTGEAKLD
jgi:hypothetical protein